MVELDKKNGFYQTEYDLLPSDTNALVLKYDVCHTLASGLEEPEYDCAKEDLNNFVNGGL